MALASVGAGAIYFLVIIVILNAYIDNKRRQKEPQLIRVIRDMKERMAMDEVHYLISDASRKVDVEAHVLRYWEEELELGIPRNEMGHRYYTDFHIRLFKQVKNLKEKGYQLKAIKHALEQMKKDGKLEGELTDELLEQDMDAALKELKEEESTAMVAAGEGMPLSASAEEKMAQFQQMMNLTASNSSWMCLFSARTCFKCSASFFFAASCSNFCSSSHWIRCCFSISSDTPSSVC